ncbi:hypothetical protein MRX96_028118 [Rhipicephalus microplus]
MSSRQAPLAAKRPLVLSRALLLSPQASLPMALVDTGQAVPWKAQGRQRKLQGAVSQELVRKTEEGVATLGQFRLSGRRVTKKEGARARMLRRVRSYTDIPLRAA